MPGRQDLERAFAARGAAPPATIEWHDTIASTNDRLKELARGGAPEWTVVLASRQTGGRGREGRAWLSPPGGLYLSVLLRPRLVKPSLLPLAAGVAVAEVAGEHGLAVALKWPNDVVVEDAGRRVRKLAGILVEASAGAGGADWVVLGIGMNLGAERMALPDDLAPTVATLSEGTSGEAADVADVAAAVVGSLRVWYDALGTSPAAIIQAWRQRAAAWWGERVLVRVGEASLEGRLVDVDADGALLVDVDGVRQRLWSGEVRRLRREG